MVKIDKVSISNALRAKIIDQIRSDLTDGRKHYGLEEFTNEKIMEFVEANRDKIQELIDRLIDAFEERGGLADLIRPELEHILEFYYDYLRIPFDDDADLFGDD